MNKEFNYFAFLGVLSFGYFIGLFFPDIDQGFQSLLGHRSIITHSILLPYLLYNYFKKKNNLTPLKTIFIVGIYLGIGLHLSADLHPKGWVGFALIKLPFNIDIGGLSPIWIGINAGVGLFFASAYLNQLTKRKLHWISYLVIALLVGLTYGEEEPHNKDAIIGTFLSLFLATFIYTKIKYRNLITKKEPKKKKQIEKKTKKKGSGIGGKVIFFMFAILILGGILFLQFNNAGTNKKANNQQKEQIKNWRADGVFKDEIRMCEGYIKNKYPKKKFTQFNWQKYTADKNKKTYTKKIKMWMKYDGLIRKNKTFKYVDCHMQVNANQSITFLGISDKYK